MAKSRGPTTSRAGAFLRELRERSGLTTDEIRRRAEISQKSAYNVETGMSKDPATCEAFARACGADDEDIATLHVLLARDRGVINVPPDISDVALRSALHILRRAPR